MKRIAVFCGSSAGFDPIYAEGAKALGLAFAKAGLDLIYGGAKVGLMGILADQVLSLGGNVIGVMPKALVDVEIAHEGLTELHVTENMHARKALIEEKADGFILMPGAAGSAEEFFEMFTWAQLGYHEKPCSIFNINNYYSEMLKQIDTMVSSGFLKPEHQAMIIVEKDADSLLNKLQNYQSRTTPKWVDS